MRRNTFRQPLSLSEQHLLGELLFVIAIIIVHLGIGTCLPCNSKVVAFAALYKLIDA